MIGNWKDEKRVCTIPSLVLLRKSPTLCRTLVFVTPTKDFENAKIPFLGCWVSGASATFMLCRPLAIPRHLTIINITSYLWWKGLKAALGLPLRDLCVAGTSFYSGIPRWNRQGKICCGCIQYIRYKLCFIDINFPMIDADLYWYASNHSNHYLDRRS